MVQYAPANAAVLLSAVDELFAQPKRCRRHPRVSAGTAAAPMPPSALPLPEGGWAAVEHVCSCERAAARACERRLLTRQRPHARAGPAVGIAQQPGLSLCGAARRRRLGHARRSAAARRSKLPRPALLPRPAPLPALRLRRPRPAPPERDERHALGGGRPLLLKGARGRGRHRLPRRRAETASRRRAELRRLRGCGLRPAPPLAPLAAAAPLPRPRQQPHRTEGRARLLVVRLRHRRGGRSRREPARAARG
mmetsp:Transcript_40268/g.130316  ORF Transcript_40268/g.130316 Transcript_40268/m.130316 type:complete len:251 (-) Transcript_40268:122-874(-)